MGLVIGKGLTLRKGYIGTDDPDAEAYIASVEAADLAADPTAEPLEIATKVAIHSFVKGAKADGFWPAIKASCILAGARTRLGALTPLVGTAPTSFNFVDGDYNRKTGLVGDGSTKYLNSGLAGTALTPNSNHLFVNGSGFETSGSAFKGSIGVFQSTNVRLNLDLRTGFNTRSYRGPDSSTAALASGFTTSGSVGGSRLASNLSKLFQNGAAIASNTTATSVVALPSANFFVYGLNLSGSPVDQTAARFNYYSIGDGLSDSAMAAYHARVTDLINAFGAAIP
jgi:hypothetical protein